MAKEKLWDKVNVLLTEPERLKLGDEQAKKRLACDALRSELEVEKAQAKARADVLKGKIEEVDQEIGQLARWIDSGEREVDIEIREDHDDGRFTVVTVRVDDGTVLRTRPMTLNEQAESKHRAQGTLSFQDDDEPSVSDTEPPPPGDDEHHERDHDEGERPDDDDEEPGDGQPVETTELEGQTLVNARKGRRTKKNGAAEATE